MKKQLPRHIAVFGASTAFGHNDIEAGGFADRLKIWMFQNHPHERHGDSIILEYEVRGYRI